MVDVFDFFWIFEKCFCDDMVYVNVEILEFVVGVFEVLGSVGVIGVDDEFVVG